MGERRASQLSPQEMFRLDHACHVIREAFGATPYLVGSVLSRHDFRDVDVRVILHDDEFDALPSLVRIFIGLTTTAWLQQQTGLPVDFQIQQQTGANLNHDGRRHAVGVRSLQNFSGDWDTSPDTSVDREETE